MTRARRVLGFVVLLLVLRAVGPASPNPVRQQPFDQMFPCYRLEFDRQAGSQGGLPSPMVVLLDIRDDAGRPIAGAQLGPDRLDDLRHWRLDLRGAAPSRPGSLGKPKSVDLTFGFPEERRFDFRVASEASSGR